MTSDGGLDARGYGLETVHVREDWIPRETGWIPCMDRRVGYLEVLLVDLCGGVGCEAAAVSLTRRALAAEDFVGGFFGGREGAGERETEGVMDWHVKFY